MKKKMVTALLAVSMLAGLSAVNVMAADDDTITVGFSQVGAESDWRTANTESMKSTFSEDNGYELICLCIQYSCPSDLFGISSFICIMRIISICIGISITDQCSWHVFILFSCIFSLLFSTVCSKMSTCIPYPGGQPKFYEQNQRNTYIKFRFSCFVMKNTHPK